MLVLAVLSAALALAIHSVKQDPLPLEVPAGFYSIESPAHPLLLQGARRHFEDARSVFLDPRTTEEYEEARIQGALHVPFDRWEELYTALEPWIAGRAVVIYAGIDRIRLADDLAGALASRGHSDSLFIFLGGVDEWRASGLPIGDGPDATLEEEDW
jgi:rhodanese-related sulfurtransferase